MLSANTIVLESRGLEPTVGRGYGTSCRHRGTCPTAQVPKNCQKVDNVPLGWHQFNTFFSSKMRPFLLYPVMTGLHDCVTETDKKQWLRVIIVRSPGACKLYKRQEMPAKRFLVRIIVLPAR